MIIVTGAAGFIGSNLVRGLNRRGITDILAVDDLTEGDKFVNLVDCKIADYMDKDDFRRRVLDGSLSHVRAVLHQGACSDTTERNGRYMLDNNYRVTLELFEFCQARAIPFIYASSAAVYGGSSVYVEDPANEGPLNVYGYSKLLFDQVLRTRMDTLKSQVVGLRYFNVYGPHEQHRAHGLGRLPQHEPVPGTWPCAVVRGLGRLCGRRPEPRLHFGGGRGGREPALPGQPGHVGHLQLRHGPRTAVQRRGRRGGQHAARRARRGRLSLAQLVELDLIRYIPFPDDLKGRSELYPGRCVAPACRRFHRAHARRADGVAEYVRYWRARK